MSNRFKDRYRRETLRRQDFDYGSNAAYFVTLNTKARSRSFGTIVEKVMQLSNTGAIAHELLLEIPRQFPYVEMGEFMVMPDHVHLVVIINKPAGWPGDRLDGDPDSDRLVASRLTDASQNQDQKPGGITGTKNPMFHDNLPRIIRWYKGRVTFEARKSNLAGRDAINRVATSQISEFAWQPRYYERIIRDQEEFQRIAEYIRANPKEWK